MNEILNNKYKEVMQYHFVETMSLSVSVFSAHVRSMCVILYPGSV